MFSRMAAMSSFMTHLNVFWQARQPRQYWMFFSLKATNATSWPASFAPPAKVWASRSELPFFLGLVEIIRTFFMVPSLKNLPGAGYFVLFLL